MTETTNTRPTASDIIEMLGGPEIVSARFKVSSSAVRHWRRKGFPDRLHHKIYKICREELDMQYDPED
jgi:hypothetical protein